MKLPAGVHVRIDSEKQGGIARRNSTPLWLVDSFILLLAGRMYGKEVTLCSCGVGGDYPGAQVPTPRSKSYMSHHICVKS